MFVGGFASLVLLGLEVERPCVQFLYQVLVTCAHLAFKRLVKGILEGIGGRESLRSHFYAFRRGLSHSGREKGLGPVLLLEIS